MLIFVRSTLHLKDAFIVNLGEIAIYMFLFSVEIINRYQEIGLVLSYCMYVDHEKEWSPCVCVRLWGGIKGEGPRFLEIMLNQGQLEEGVEQKARQRLKRMLPLAFKWARECGIKKSRAGIKQGKEKAYMFFFLPGQSLVSGS